MTAPLKDLPHIKFLGTAEAMILVAASQLGYTEQGDNDTAFGKWYGLNGSPWCAMFVSWCSRQAGCSKIIPKHAYTPAGADWFKTHGRWGHTPRVGAIAYYDTAGMGRISHTGIVDWVSADKKTWTSIEGNTNAQGSREGKVVRRQKRATTGARGGFGYPAYEVSAKVVEIKLDKPVNLANVQKKARKTGLYDGRVASALKKAGCTPDRAGYAKWQRSKAGGSYTGGDADGIAGKESLTALGKAYGWKVA